MNFQDQIVDLIEKKGVAEEKLDAIKLSVSSIKSDNGRLKRTIKSLADNDITINSMLIYDADNNYYSSLYDLLSDVLKSNESIVASLEQTITETATEIKKLNKAIETLKSLTDIAA
jgi:hypothetical protein